MFNIFISSLPFIARKRKSHIPVFVISADKFIAWSKKQAQFVKNQIMHIDPDKNTNEHLCLRESDGSVFGFLSILNSDITYFEICPVVHTIKSAIKQEELKSTSFYLETHGIKDSTIEKLAIGWAWGCYKFEPYKKDGISTQPCLVLDKTADKKRIHAFSSSVNTLKNLVNTPSNDCGPEELEGFIRALAEEHKAKISVTKDKQLLTKNFPLIYTVGEASPRRPRLLDLTWGKAKDPKITLVGKGVCFDTGGLNLKPGQYMRHMKKDMGGAAHVLGLAMLIMALKLPVRLRVLIPAVENAVAGNAFRPGDILRSRKGLFVENTNTDAEGRLILADALTYACEENPDLIIDFATLTGSARAGLGPDIPALFSNNADLARQIQDRSENFEDPVWAMPLWQAYRKHIETGPADMINSAGLPGDLIYSALFLESFLDKGKQDRAPDWVHLDCYAWEQTGKPGRPTGGADTGMRAIFGYLETTYTSSPQRPKK